MQSPLSDYGDGAITPASLLTSPYNPHRVNSVRPSANVGGGGGAPAFNRKHPPPRKNTAGGSRSAKHRLLQLDLLRGLIMIIMAWDHSRDFISDNMLPKNKGNEFWVGELSTYDNNFGLFLQRWLPHFCAPGFFWLMGIGMAFFHSSRVKQFHSGWSNLRIVRHFFIRGMLLILMDRIVNLPFYVEMVDPDHYKSPFLLPGDKNLRGFLGIFEVLTALGLSMILCGFLLPVFAWLSSKIRWIRNDTLILTGGQIAAIVLGVASFVVSNVVVVHYQDEDLTKVTPFPRSGSEATTFADYLTRFLVLPGLYPQGMISYPILPWIGICLFGIATGYFFASPLGRNGYIAPFCLVQGIVCWCGFLVIRTIGGSTGNLRGWPRGEPSRKINFGIAFLDVCKYPPSVAYALLTLGGNSLLAVVFDRVVLHMQHCAAREEQAQATKAWKESLKAQQHAQHGMAIAEDSQDGSLNGLRNPMLHDADMPSLAESLLVQPSAELETITLAMVQPSLGTEEEEAEAVIRSRSVWCSSTTWNEFPMWPWYGRFLLFPLLTFGRVPLFFYVVHWYVLGAGSLVIHSISDGLYLGYVPVWWFGLICFMFVLCAPYAKFKDRSGVDSLWRFL